MPTPLSRGQIVQQLAQGLQREIGHSIAIERLLADPRYARDVLLVCDALPCADLRALAALFRAEAGAPAAWPLDDRASTTSGPSQPSGAAAPGRSGDEPPPPAAPTPLADPPRRMRDIDPAATPTRRSWLSRLRRR